MSDLSEYLAESEADRPPIRIVTPSADMAPFRALGHDSGTFFYLPNATKQIVELCANHHTKLNMMQLASLEYWADHFPPARSGDTNWDMAAQWAMNSCKVAGIFDAENIRGRGAWLDKDRVVFHIGKKLLVDGQETPLDELKSRYFYQQGKLLEWPEIKPATAEQGSNLLNLIGLLNFKRKLDKPILAGWLFIAPICGLLSWRSHVWVTGPKGSGKSWVCDELVKRVLGDYVIYAAAASTEAGLRQQVNNDSLPILFDEAEANDPIGMERIQKIIELARQASSAKDSGIIKGSSGGTSKRFYVRSSFCFASIAASAIYGSDISRIANLELIKREGEDAREHFTALEAVTLKLLTDEFCAAIRARSVKLAGNIRENARRFAEALQVALGDRRQGDQYGTLFAGAYSLCNDGIISPEKAREWVKAQDWSQFKSESFDFDEHKCLEMLVCAHIKEGSDTYEVGGLIRTMALSEDDAKRSTARYLLSIHGIKVNDGTVKISNTHPKLSDLFRGSQFSRKWHVHLVRLKGSKNLTAERIGNAKVRAISVPLEYFVDDERHDDWKQTQEFFDEKNPA